MNDRELLELAAKANNSPNIKLKTFGAWFDDERERYWNPLADDGDALRLAVKLGIGIRSHGPNHWQQPNVAVALWDIGDRSGRVVVEQGTDSDRAIRRAIVRAATEIWRAMPPAPQNNPRPEGDPK